MICYFLRHFIWGLFSVSFLFVFLVSAAQPPLIATKSVKVLIQANPWTVGIPKSLAGKPSLDGIKSAESRYLGTDFTPYVFKLLPSEMEYTRYLRDEGLTKLKNERKFSASVPQGIHKLVVGNRLRSDQTGTTWGGYFSTTFTRYEMTFDNETKKILREDYLSEGENVCTILYIWDKKFSDYYPSRAEVKHGDMVFRMQFHFLGDEWRIKKSEYFYKGKLSSTVTP